MVASINESQKYGIRYTIHFETHCILWWPMDAMFFLDPRSITSFAKSNLEQNEVMHKMQNHHKKRTLFRHSTKKPYSNI